MELLRLKKEYNQMVKKEISKAKKDKDASLDNKQKSPDKNMGQSFYP